MKQWSDSFKWGQVAKRSFIKCEPSKYFKNTREDYKLFLLFVFCWQGGRGEEGVAVPWVWKIQCAVICVYCWADFYILLLVCCLFGLVELILHQVSAMQIIAGIFAPHISSFGEHYFIVNVFLCLPVWLAAYQLYLFGFIVSILYHYS